MSAEPFTPTESAALDRATPPPLRAGFARDVAAAALASRLPPPRRSLRGSIRRHRALLTGAGVLLLTSAAAAASGVLGRLPDPLPAIAAVFSPAPRPTPTARPSRPKVEKPVPQAVSLPAPAATPADTLLARRLERREAIRARIRAMPPEQREAVRRRVAERHPEIAARARQLREEGDPHPIARAISESPRAQEIRERFERRRAWRDRRRAGMPREGNLPLDR